MPLKLMIAKEKQDLMCVWEGLVRKNGRHRTSALTTLLHAEFIRIDVVSEEMLGICFSLKCITLMQVFYSEKVCGKTV